MEDSIVLRRGIDKAVQAVVDYRVDALAQTGVRRIGQENGCGDVQPALGREFPGIFRPGVEGELEGPARLDDRLMEPVEAACCESEIEDEQARQHARDDEKRRVIQSSTSIPAVRTAVSYTA